MKIILIILLLFSVSLSFSQQITKKEYDRLSDIFAYDVQLTKEEEKTKNFKDTYLSHKLRYAVWIINYWRPIG